MIGPRKQKGLIYWPIMPAWRPLVAGIWHMNSANGANSTPNSSSRAVGAIVTNGFFNANVSTAQFKFGTASWHVFGNGGGGIAVSDSQLDWEFKNSCDFTVEWWQNLTNLTKEDLNEKVFFDGRSSGHGAQFAPLIRTDPTQSPGDICLFANGAVQISGTGVLTAGVWQAIALCKVNNILQLFIDGTQVGSDYAESHDWRLDEVCIGCETSSFGGFGRGFYDEFRVTKGTGWYKNSYTPATAEFGDQ